ncbi:MAG: cytochrome b/b6 domain-containing protein [Burkholderiales bacterium]|nr:cytochrome b/b6 domain-containing protein [Burkholderiales bacterium]
MVAPVNIPPSAAATASAASVASTAPPATSASHPRRSVRVWDLPTRLFHWVLALSIVGSVVTGSIGGGAMTWHFRLGHLALALLVFRLVWGLVGGRWSRFASFVYAPGTLLRYLRGERRPGEHLDIGHTPLGAASVFAMLAILVVQVGTGLVADDEIANVGPLNKYVATATGLAATAWHKNYGKALIITLVVLHIGAIVFYRLRRKVDLIGPMLSGDKALPADGPADVPASRDDLRTRGLALLLAVAAAGLALWVMRQGG